jgi:dihydroflavonol-4-reductase
LDVILVTGGTGFLGATVISALLAQGKRVRATKRNSSHIPQHLTQETQIEWVNADITDFFALETAFEGVSEVYHCAAMVTYQPDTKSLMVRTNVTGTSHVVNLCLAQQARLVHVSSIAAIGTPAPPRTLAQESDAWLYDGTQSPYSISKYESEMEVWRGIAEGLDAVIVNPSLIIGWQAGDQGSGAVFKLIQKGLPFYPPGSTGFVDVEDVAKAMLLLMEDRSISAERYIVSQLNLTHKAFLTKSSHFLNKPAPKYAAKKWMLNLAALASQSFSRLTGKPQTLTLSSVRASCKHLAYSNEKLLKQTGMTFKPLETTLSEIATRFLQSPLS